MKQLFLSAVTVAALTAPGFAADIPRKAVPYAPVAAFSWTGFYAGVNAGYAWTRGGGSSVGGFAGGGQIGYNWQAGSWVLGVEVDFQGTSQKSTDTIIAGLVTVDGKIPWFATARARVGYAFDRSMIYFTGGAGWVNYKATLNVGAFSTSDSTTKAGWTIGGGYEAMLWDRWSAKIEYLYIDSGNVSLTLLGVTGTSNVKENVVRAGLNYHF